MSFLSWFNNKRTNSCRDTETINSSFPGFMNMNKIGAKLQNVNN